MAAVLEYAPHRSAGRPGLRVVTAPGSDGGSAAWIHVDRPPAVRAATGSCARVPASTYRRRQAVAAGLVVAVVLAVWAALGVLGGGGPLPASERPSAAAAVRAGQTYVVQPGDTLWSIAQHLRPGGDPRPVVDRLAAINGGATIYVGERIPLPAAP